MCVCVWGGGVTAEPGLDIGTFLYLEFYVFTTPPNPSLLFFLYIFLFGGGGYFKTKISSFVSFCSVFVVLPCLVFSSGEGKGGLFFFKSSLMSGSSRTDRP